MIPKINTAAQIKELFPKNIDQIEIMADKIMQESAQALEIFYNVDNAKRNFDNTARTLDNIISTFNVIETLLYTVEAVYPDEKMRNAAHHNSLKLNAFAVDNFWQNKKIYDAFKYYSDNNLIAENLTDEQRYFIVKLLETFHRNGVHLSQEIQDRLKNIQKELAEHCLTFDRNISMDNRFIEVTLDALTGLSDNFIRRLQCNNGKYKLGVDYPTYFTVMDNCSVSSTRYELWRNFVNRAYPANEEELAQIIALRDEFAHLVGYDSFAEFDISDQMAETPTRVETFLRQLLDMSNAKFKKEIETLKNNLPEGVTLTNQNTIKPCDLAYIKSNYKKKNYNLDESSISEYFPLESTLEKLLDIYEKFLGLTFKKAHLNEIWHEHVEYIQVYQGGKFIGSLLLDLFPRPGKYTHACHISIVPTITTGNKEFYPALSLVIANFPWPAPGQPALLQRNDVITFFHEFGHALHGLLGSTELAWFSGTNVKRDFVEMPSQMLEEWMWDPTILKQVSGHYKTGEPLPDDIINNIIGLKHFDTGHWIHRQVFYSLLALAYFKDGAYKNLHGVNRDLLIQTLPYIEFSQESHEYAAFGHLTNYGAKYYGYLWSKVFALDMFDYIKNIGLLDKKIGKKYISDVLSKGGSVEPGKLLKDFLGRDANPSAFFKDLGL